MSDVLMILSTVTIFGLIYVLHRVEKQRDEARNILKGWGDNMIAMRPGSCTKITLPGTDGGEWALIRYEDFELIASKGGYSLTPGEGKAFKWEPAP
jgi:hypothetical protein